RTFNGRRGRQAGNGRRGGVRDVDDLAGGAAVAAMIGGRPGPRHDAVLRATAGGGHVGEGQRRAGIAGVGRRRRGEDRRRRAFNGRRGRQAGNGRRGGVLDVDDLAGGAAVAAMIGGRPGPRHDAVLRATAGGGHVGEGQRRAGIAGVGRRRRGEDRRRRTFNGRRGRQAGNGRRGGVLDVDDLAGGAAVAAMIGGRPGPRHDAVLRATAGGGHVGEGQRRAGIAGVGRRRRGEHRRRRT